MHIYEVCQNGGKHKPGELVDYISIFKLTEICIEAPEKRNTMDKYSLYKRSEKELSKDEVKQIVFRLIDKFKLDTIYPVNARTIAEELPESKDDCYKTIL